LQKIAETAGAEKLIVLQYRYMPDVHFKVMGSSGQEPVHDVLYSYRPLSTHAVGDGVAGQPVSGSQQSTLAAAVEVILLTTVADAVAKTHSFPCVQPHGRDEFPPK